jgi:iron complex outermembrane receptor protein
VSRALRTPGRVDRDLSLVGFAPGFNPPLFVQIAGDPTFKPEVLIGWEAGYRQLLRRNLYIDVAAFHNQYDNVESFGTISVSFPTSPYLQELVTEPYANGLRGTSSGIEIAPDWRLSNWVKLRGSYSHLNIALHSKRGFSQATYASSYEGSSPENQVSAQAVFAPQRGLEIVPDYRFVGSLPGQNVASYQTADLNITYQMKDHLQLSATGRNLLQPLHEEFQGDNSNVVQIRRAVFGGIEWTW